MATTKKESTAKNWKTLDLATLSPKAKAAYAHQKDLMDKGLAARRAFEQVINEEAQSILKPLGKKFIFAYQYGVGIAVADLEPVKTGNSKAVSLSDYLAHNAA